MDNSRLLFLIAVKLTIIIVIDSVTRKKLPNVYKSYQKMTALEKWYILTRLQKLPKNVRDLGKLIVAKCLNNLPNVQ